MTDPITLTPPTKDIPNQYGVLYRDRGEVTKQVFGRMDRGTHDTVQAALDEAYEMQGDGPLCVFSIDFQTGRIITLFDHFMLDDYNSRRQDDENRDPEDDEPPFDPIREYGMLHRGAQGVL